MWRDRAKLSKSCIVLASARETSKIKACMRVWAQAMESSRIREARAQAVSLAASSVGRCCSSQFRCFHVRDRSVALYHAVKGCWL